MPVLPPITPAISQGQTGQWIVNRALTILGMLEQGGQPSLSDSTAALDMLNVMWDAWSIDEGLIYALIHLRFPLTYSAACYKLGPSNVPDFVANRPDRKS